LGGSASLPKPTIDVAAIARVTPFPAETAITDR
jgi:hypothetical protein